MSERLVSILLQEGKPLGFEKAYEKLVASGWEMPKQKPKLVVRKALFNTEVNATSNTNPSFFRDCPC